jgi:hypothetical protein
MAVCNHVERVPFASPFRGEVKGDTATISIQRYRNLVWPAGRRDLLDWFTFPGPIVAGQSAEYCSRLGQKIAA